MDSRDNEPPIEFGSDEIAGQMCVALSVSEQADEGPRLRVFGHAGPALLMRSMHHDHRCENATGLIRDNLSPSYTTASKTVCRTRKC